MTEGEEGGVGDASLSAGDTCGGVEDSSEEPRGAASSESPEGGNTRTFRAMNYFSLELLMCNFDMFWCRLVCNCAFFECQTSISKLIACLMLQMFAPRGQLSPSAAFKTEEKGFAKVPKMN